LRERREEIPRLVGEVLEEQGWGGEVGRRFSREAMQVLQEYNWPGNVRELEGVVLRSVAMKGEGLLGPGDLDFGFTVGEGLPSLGVGKGVVGEVSLGGEAVGEEENFFDVVVSALAHEIKNPLVAINTFAYLLPEKYEDEEFRGQFSRLVSMDVRRVNEVLESLLEYGRLSGPRMRGQDLNLVLEGVLGERGEELGRRGLRVERELGEGLPLVLFDGMQLGFVLRSLIGGVVWQVRGGKVMRVWTGKGEGYVEMRVRYEDGEGVYGGEWKGEGKGMERWSLALALARRVVVRNGGEMGVSSEEGAGLVIRLRFRVVGGSEAGEIKGSHA
jgi:two-component sensor histidine kinase